MEDQESIGQVEPKTAPSHYRDGQIQPTKVIDDWKLNFYLGNTLKYICRAGKKSGESMSDDLQKALWYLVRDISKRDDVADKIVQLTKGEL